MPWELTGNNHTNETVNFLGTTDQHALVIKTNGMEALRISPNGNVGVGTTNPSDHLTVGGGSLADTKIEVDAGGDQYAGLRIKNSQGSWVWQVVPSADSPGGRMRLADETAGREWLAITHPGNVGIGTTNPGNKLEVIADSPNIAAVVGENNAAPTAAGDPTTGGRGVVGNSGSGIGVLGQSDAGDAVFGNSRIGRGVLGNSTFAIGVLGQSGSGDAVFGNSTSGRGVVGWSVSDVAEGVGGFNNKPRLPAGPGVLGVSVAGVGVHGHSTFGAGVVGDSDQGLAGLFNGNVEVTGDLCLVNQDCAEDFDIVDHEHVEPGTVMAIDKDGALHVCKSAYDKRVAGVISGAGNLKPAIILGKQQSLSKRMPIALLGKVYCKVDASTSPIAVGDLLTTSPNPGYAMKAIDPLKAFGTVIGKALRPLDNGLGLIPILIALQ